MQGQVLVRIQLRPVNPADLFSVQGERRELWVLFRWVEQSTMLMDTAKHRGRAPGSLPPPGNTQPEARRHAQAAGFFGPPCCMLSSLAALPAARNGSPLSPAGVYPGFKPEKLPAVPGLDGMGVVEQNGPGASRFKPGKVACCRAQGSKAGLASAAVPACAM